MKPRSNFPNTPRVRKPKPVTEVRLYHAAIYYLQRYSATAAHVATILQRKVQRWTKDEPDWAIGADEKIAATVAKIVEQGFINDAIFAESRVRSLRRQGKSATIIKQHLRQKGVTDDTQVTEALDKGDTDFVQENSSGLRSFDDPEDDSDTVRALAEQQALQRFIKRKRLLQSDELDTRQKDIAKILRGGFSWAIVKDTMGALDDMVPEGD